MGIAGEFRHNRILEKLRENGRVYVKEVAEELGVTEVTVRRDLAYLDKNGLIKKIYGGGVQISPEMNPSVHYRQRRKIEAKKVVGKLAADLVCDGDVIYLEAGSTCFEIIPFLGHLRDLTVIVNSLYLMRRLAELANCKVILIGGQYRRERMDTVGPNAEAAIGELSGFKAFTGADDIAIDAGISGADVVTVGFAKLVLKQASEIIFVGDHTKFDNPALYKIADIDELDCIVTDQEPREEWKKAAVEKGIKLIYPEE